MRKIVLIIAFFAFLASLAYAEEGYSGYSFARLSYIRGDIFVQRAEGLGYEEGVVNLAIVEGDRIGSREGRGEIHFGRGNYLRLDSDTQVEFINLPTEGNDGIKLHLLAGNIFLRVSFLEIEKNFEIHSPDASFYILEEGLYRVGIRENRETELFVFEGAAEAAGEGGSLLVKSNEKLIASDGRFLSDPVYFYASDFDDFAEWNQSRDALHSRPVSRNYLPSELDEYESELDEYGRWVYESPYGYVWVPYVYHQDWRPYFYGRWIWYPAIGWTWVSYEPWGWCVYHYGRWHWRLGLGWYWIPHTLWGPAWVHWYWGYDYIGWCPLTYYGYPAVIINNYFYARYYGQSYPANSRALVVVRKDQLQSRTISRAALSQDRITRIGKISLSAKQPDVRPVVRKISLSDTTVARALSKSQLRPVNRDYGSEQGLSQLKSSSLKRSPSSARSSSSKERSVPRRMESISRSSLSSRTPAQYPSESSPGNSRLSGGSLSRANRSESSALKTFPSRLAPSLSRSTPSSSATREQSPLSSSRVKERSGSNSLRNFSSPSKENSYTPSSSRTSPSRFPSLRTKQSTSSFSSTRPSSPKASSSLSRSTERSSFSSSRTYSSPSRSVSVPKNRSSSSKIGSSSISRGSSAPSGVSRSSGHSSSSRSVSGKSIKKK